jgi:hypothetical protein
MSSGISSGGSSGGTPGKRSARTTPNKWSNKKKRTKREPRPSPGARTPGGTRPLKNSITITLVKNDDLNPEENPPVYLIVRGNDYMEKGLTHPFYNANPSAPDYHINYTQFVHESEAFNMVINPLDGTPGGHGEFEITVNPQAHGENPVPGQADWRRKALIFEVTPDFTTDKIEQFFTEFLKPLIITKLTGTPIFTYAPRPTLDPARPRCNFFSEKMVTEDIINSLTFFYTSPELTLEQYLKQKQEHLYCAWAPGGVPMAIITAYNLGQEHLAPADWQNYQAHLTQLEEELADIEEEEEVIAQEVPAEENDQQDPVEPIVLQLQADVRVHEEKKDDDDVIESENDDESSDDTK